MSRWGVVRRLFGALVVGVATLFQPKRQHDQHWAIPPTWPVEDESQDATGET